MARQSLMPDEWIIADGGTHPIVPTMGQTVVRNHSPRGTSNFLRNLYQGILATTGDVIIFWEDDDWYQSTHIETMVTLIMSSQGVVAAGDDLQRYYHIPSRQWRIFHNKGASLCQTAIRREMVPVFLAVVKERIQRNNYGADTFFWSRVPPRMRCLRRIDTVVGIKGLPGSVGLGIGHRPNGWARDTSGQLLRSWIGDEDAGLYFRLLKASV